MFFLVQLVITQESASTIYCSGPGINKILQFVSYWKLRDWWALRLPEGTRQLSSSSWPGSRLEGTHATTLDHELVAGMLICVLIYIKT